MQKSRILRKIVPFMMSFSLLFGSAASVMAENEATEIGNEENISVSEDISFDTGLADPEAEAFGEMLPESGVPEQDSLESEAESPPDTVPYEEGPEIVIEPSKYSVYVQESYEHVQLNVADTKEALGYTSIENADTTPYAELLSEENLVIVTVNDESDQILDSSDIASIQNDNEQMKAEFSNTGTIAGEYQAGTVLYISAQPDLGYRIKDLQVIDEENSYVVSEFDAECGLYSFTVPEKDVYIDVTAEEIAVEPEIDLEETEIEALEEYIESEGFVVTRAAMLQAAAASEVRTITFNMNGFISYSAEGYGSGYDAMFYINAANYKGNGNGYCLDPSVQAPGHDRQGQSISYKTTVNDYTDPMLLKIMYYGFGGPGDITGSHASTPTARHILTHMVSVRRAKELGIPGSGDYKYKANATAIAKADALYAAIQAKPAINGRVSILTPVAGQQTIMLLADYSIPETKGKLKLTKTSANVSITQGNPCYSLKGAGYAVYSDKALTKLAGTFTTNEDGTSSATLSLNPGTYYVKEVTVPKGYLLDETVYTATVTAGNTTTVRTSDQPANDPVTVLLQKVDAVTGQATERLKGAQFTVKYYPVENEADIKTPKYTWVFETNDKGIIRLSDEYKVSGDTLVKGSTGSPIIPLGFITIQETKAPSGYLINDTVYVCHTEIANDVVRTTNLPTGEMAVKEQPAIADLSVTKTVTGSGGNKNKVFHFQLSLYSKSGMELPEGVKYILTEEGKDEIIQMPRLINGICSFTLHHGQTATFKDIPIGLNYNVVETDGESEGYKVTITNGLGVISKDGVSVDVVNNKEITIPTGADSNRNAMMSMAMLAGMMLFVLVGVRYSRKRR